jgi:hypothetical protein
LTLFKIKDCQFEPQQNIKEGSYGTGSLTCKGNIKNYPKSWDMNGRADDQWLIDFIKRNNKVVSLRKPQATMAGAFLEADFHFRSEKCDLVAFATTKKKRNTM